MKVKITQKGWGGYTGDLGTVPFVDGVSTRDIARHEALALGSYVSVVEINEAGDELGPVSPAHDLLKTVHVSATVAEPLERDAAPVAVEAVVDDFGDEYELLPLELEPEVPARAAYTVEELEAIASEKGINGLREIGNEFGVKNTAIKGLIAEIMNAQRKRQEA